MLDARRTEPPHPAMRFANVDRLEEWMAALRDDRLPRVERRGLSRQEELEESLFLGLRRNQGVETTRLRQAFGEAAITTLQPVFTELRGLGLLADSEPLRLTDRGRMLSNEVFTRLIGNNAALAS
jgi:oxygen-independent coproporphyrinogen-3 oxidase